MVALAADQQKKVYILAGLAGVLGLVGILAWHPWSHATVGDTAAPAAAGTSGAQTASAPAAPAAPRPVGNGAGPGTATATTVALTAGAAVPVAPGAPQIRAAQGARRDPFLPEMITPTPLPTVPPPPTPQPPVIVPQPVGPLPVNLPSAGGATSSGGLLSKSPLLVELPPVHIHRMSDQATQPSELPPRRPDQGGNVVLPPSPNKRISGVVIGDAVGAIIEISDGDQVVTRVVHPGEEVEGIKILRIERVREGDRLVTRMIVREQGEERRVDLKASPSPQGGGEGGSSGSGGYPGGRGSSSGGSGYPGGRPGGGFRPPLPPGT